MKHSRPAAEPKRASSEETGRADVRRAGWKGRGEGCITEQRFDSWTGLLSLSVMTAPDFSISVPEIFLAAREIIRFDYWHQASGSVWGIDCAEPQSEN